MAMSVTVTPAVYMDYVDHGFELFAHKWKLSMKTA